jgi:hypothetical protein
MRSTTYARTKSLHVAAIAAWIGLAASAAVADTCTTLNLTPGETTALTANYSTASGNCLVVNGENAVLDLAGHSITTTYTTEEVHPGSGTALRCGSSDMIITDSIGGGSISGKFAVGISSCSTVENVVISGADFGVLGTVRAIRNSTIDVVHAPTFVTLRDSASTISDNEVTTTQGGIFVIGLANLSMPGKARIQRNIIHGGDNYAQISVDDGVPVHVESNLMLDRVTGACIGAGDATTYQRNYCDCTECSGADAAVDFPSYATFAACPGQSLPGANISVIGSTYRLNANLDLAGTSGSCIKVINSGKTVDLNGHTITNSSTGGTAIEFTANLGAVVDSATAKGGITGNFAIGIKDAQTVTNTEIKNGVDIGISNANTSTGSLISLTGSAIKADDKAVSGYLYTRADSIVRDNLLRGGNKGFEFLGFNSSSGTARAPIYENVIRESSVAAMTTSGTAQYTNVHDNLMYRRDSGVTGTCHNLATGTTVSDLLCNCQNQCEGDQPPILFPLF